MHVVSIYANLLERKKAFTQEKSSTRFRCRRRRRRRRRILRSLISYQLICLIDFLPIRRSH